MSERWLPLPGYEGSYEVSDQGRVKSLPRMRPNSHRLPGRMLKQPPMPRGYKVVTLWKDGKQKTALVHRLVLFAFVGPEPPGHEVRHLDGDPANNALANLEWGTPSENNLDQVLHGTHPNASKDVCPAGHPYNEANTYVYPGRPHRGCRQCRREYQQKYQARRKEAA